MNLRGLRPWLVGGTLFSLLAGGAWYFSEGLQSSPPAAVVRHDIPPMTNDTMTHRPVAHHPLEPSPAGWGISPRHQMPRTEYHGRWMVPILEYHDIEYIPHDKYGMAPAAFAEQMEFLHDHGFHTITLLQLYDAFYGHGTLPPRPIVLTFDDGYQSVYTTAYPILRRFGFVGTVFVITGYVGHGPHMLTWSELREMQDSGVMDVESHTVHHVNLAKAPPAVVQQELLDSQVTIVRQLHHPCRFFCYPFGGYSRVAIEDLHRDGYWLATTSRTGYATPADGPYRLRRLQVYEGEPITAFSEMLQPSFRGPVVS